MPHDSCRTTRARSAVVMEGGETLVEETLTAGDGVGDATRGFELEVEAVEVAVKAAVSASGSGSRSAAAAGPPSTERAARQMEDLLARYPALPATPNNMRAVASLPSNIPGPFSLSVSFRDESGPRNPAWVVRLGDRTLQPPRLPPPTRQSRNTCAHPFGC